MKFYCDNCNAKYLIADEKVRGKILRIRCKKCSHVIVVREPTKPVVADADANVERQTLSSSASAASRAAIVAALDWYYAMAGQTHGPFTFEVLSDKFATGQLGDEAYVWNETFTEWTAASEREEFSHYFAQGVVRKPARPTMALKAIDVEAALEQARLLKEQASTVSGPITSLGPPGGGGEKSQTPAGSGLTSVPTALGRPGGVGRPKSELKPKRSLGATSNTSIIKRASQTRGSGLTATPPLKKGPSSKLQKLPNPEANRSGLGPSPVRSNMSGTSSSIDASTSERLRMLRSRLSSRDSGTLPKMSLKERLRQLRQSAALSSVGAGGTANAEGKGPQKTVHNEITRVQAFTPPPEARPSGIIDRAMLDVDEPKFPSLGKTTPVVAVDTTGVPVDSPLDESPSVVVEESEPETNDVAEPLAEVQETAEAAETDTESSEESAEIAEDESAEATEEAPEEEVAEHSEEDVGGEDAAEVVADPSAEVVEEAEEPADQESAEQESTEEEAATEEVASAEEEEAAPTTDVEEESSVEEEEAQPEEAPSEEDEDKAAAVAPDAPLPLPSPDVSSSVTPPAAYPETGQEKNTAMVVVLALMLVVAVVALVVYFFVFRDNTGTLENEGTASQTQIKTNATKAPEGVANTDVQPPENAGETPDKAGAKTAEEPVENVITFDLGEVAILPEAEPDKEPVKTARNGKNNRNGAAGNATATTGNNAPANKTSANTSAAKMNLPDIANGLKGSDALDKGLASSKATKEDGNGGLNAKGVGSTTGEVAKLSNKEAPSKVNGVDSSALANLMSGSRKVERVERVEHAERPTATEAPATLPTNLSREALQQGFKNVRRSASQCLERHMKRSGGRLPKSKVQVIVTIENSGSVSKVTMNGVANTVFDSCMRSHKSRWRFPRFSGRSIQVSRKFVLQ